MISNTSLFTSTRYERLFMNVIQTCNALTSAGRMGIFNLG